MELHSEIESYRRVLTLRTPEGQDTTVIIMRRKSAVWLTLNGAEKTAEKTTVVMVDPGGQSTDRDGLRCGRRCAANDDPTVPMRAVRYLLDDLLPAPGQWPLGWPGPSAGRHMPGQVGQCLQVGERGVVERCADIAGC